MLKYFLLSLCLLPSALCFTGWSQPAHPDTLFFKDRLQPLTEDNVFRTDQYFHWGASIIKGDDGLYHLFYSRWKKELTFYAWLTHSEIAHATSKNPAGPWTYKETVLTSRGAGYGDAITCHNPKIKYFDGKYYLYYVSTNLGDKAYSEYDLVETARVGYSHPNWAILRPNQRTFVAVADSLNGPWERPDHPLIEPDGPFEYQPKPVISDLDTEDMSLWYDQKRDYYYGVFHAHSFIGMVSSPDGVNWGKATEFALTANELRFEDGTLLKPDRMERPFVYLENDEPLVLSLAVKKGDDSFTVFIPVAPKTRPLPNPRQVAWQEAEMGALISWDLHVFDGLVYNQAQNRITPMPDYQIFNPKELDTDQWIRAVKASGCTFAILTVTHETGFALYPSDYNPYCMKALKYKDGKGDVVQDFVNSCRKYDIKPGLYVGIRWNSFFGVHNFQVNGEGTFRDNRQAYYNHMIEGMVTELCTRYGELFEIWFDGGADHPDNGVPDVLPIVQQYQPNCLFYHNSQLAEARWGGSESGTVPYPCWATFPNFYSHASNMPDEQYHYLKHGDPKGNYWMPAMSDAPLRGYSGGHDWFWEPGSEGHLFPLENLMNIYMNSVGHNSTLIIGLTPDDRGLIPEPDMMRLKEWGDEIRQRFGQPIASSGPIEGLTKIELKVNPDKPVQYIILQEDIRFGERIRSYQIEARVNKKWIMLGEGSCIGHKRIQEIEPVRCDRVRLRILDTTGPVRLKGVGVYTEHD